MVIRLKALFEEKAYGEILRQILMLVEELLKVRVMQGQETPVACECGCARLVLNGGQARVFRTSLGDVTLDRTARVKCAGCGKTFALLLRFLGIDKHQSKTHELEKLVLEAVAGDTYRRANKSVRKMTGVRAGHTTFHNWVLSTAGDEITVPDGVVGSAPGEVFADGTKCKSSAKDVKGDIKVMIGVNASGEVFPIGTWTHRETWEQISEEIDKRQLVFPDGTILVSDGEPGLADALSRHVTDQQRCHWHIVRDTYHAMWQDGGKAGDARPVQDALKSILAIELPEGDFQKVSEEEKGEIEVRMQDAEFVIGDLIGHLRAKGFTTVADYLQRSKSYMFSYVRRWLKLGISCPRASSLIERTMREIARRTKRIAYNWKEDGLGKVAKIVLKIFSQPEEWEKYWSKLMDISQNVFLSFKIIKS